jgi:hypothetical protein
MILNTARNEALAYRSHPPRHAFPIHRRWQRNELSEFEPSFVRIEDAQIVATTGRTHHANVRFNGRNESQ